jgi:hypothetical protein
VIYPTEGYWESHPVVPGDPPDLKLEGRDYWLHPSRRVADTHAARLAAAARVALQWFEAVGVLDDPASADATVVLYQTLRHASGAERRVELTVGALRELRAAVEAVCGAAGMP